MKGKEKHYLEGKIQLARPVAIDHLVTLYYFEFAKNYRFHGEHHDFWEFVYVDKGEVTVTADDRELRLTSGTIIFHKPNEFHSFYASGGSAPNIVVVTFCSSSRLMESFEGRLFHLDSRERNLLSEVVRAGKAAFAYPFTFPLVRKGDAPIGCEQRLLLHLELLLLQLLSRTNAGPKRPALQSLAKDKELHTLTHTIIKYMEERMEEPLTLQQISSSFHIAMTRLKEMFKRETGQPVMKYFIRMKIDRAKTMIREDDLTLSEIAGKLGFASPHYFSKAFKKETGLSPSEYARSVKARVEDV